MHRKNWFILYRWRAKLGSLVLATLLWLLIRHGIAHTRFLSPLLPPSPPPLGLAPSSP